MARKTKVRATDRQIIVGFKADREMHAAIGKAAALGDRGSDDVSSWLRGVVIGELRRLGVWPGQAQGLSR